MLLENFEFIIIIEFTFTWLLKNGCVFFLTFFYYCNFSMPNFFLKNIPLCDAKVFIQPLHSFLLFKISGLVPAFLLVIFIRRFLKIFIVIDGLKIIPSNKKICLIAKNAGENDSDTIAFYLKN